MQVSVDAPINVAAKSMDRYLIIRYQATELFLTEEKEFWCEESWAGLDGLFCWTLGERADNSWLCPALPILWGYLAALDLWKEAVTVSSPELHSGLVLITLA